MDLEGGNPCYHWGMSMQPARQTMVWFVAASWLVATAPAGADEPAIAGGWIKATLSSSTCIGKPKTPLCAVETALACRLRRDERLCGKVDLPLVSPPDTSRPIPNPDPATTIEAIAVEYRVEDFAEADDGHALVGLALRHYGQNGLIWPEQGWRLVNYRLVRAPRGWRVAGMSWTPQPRRIGPRDASSSCLGDRRLPVCAVETAIACRVRGTAALCDPAGPDAAGTGEAVTYIVDRLRRSAPAGPGGRAGDVTLTVWLAESTEPALDDPNNDPLTRPPVFAMVAYTLQRTGKVWRVTGRSAAP